MKKTKHFQTKFSLLFAMILMLNCSSERQGIYEERLWIDFSDNDMEINSFWNSTGFSPADFFLREDMKLAMDYYGSIGQKGLEYIRPHYMLNLIGSKDITSDNPVYNWSRLDDAIDFMVENNIKPIFELMGFPSLKLEVTDGMYDERYQGQENIEERFIPDFTNPEDLETWKRFIYDLAVHMQDRYGKDDVESWLFEVTNEPDVDHFWPFGIRALLNYYDACSEGLKEANPKIKFGGPGTARGLSDEFKSILAHCDTGVNFFTGERGVRLDFISFHEKELPEEMINEELEIIQYIQENHPDFMSKTLINDESDPMVGWSRQYWWRTGPWYAAYVCQTIDLHYQLLKRELSLNYDLLSNDNAFLGDWYQRTHFARFSDQANPDNFYLIKKPVLNVLNFLSRTGDSWYPVYPSSSGHKNYGVIATKRDNGDLVLLCYNKPDIGKIKKGEKVQLERNQVQNNLYKSQDIQLEINLKSTGLNSVSTALEYRLDEQNGNPFRIWHDQGKPTILSRDQFQELSDAQHPGLRNITSSLEIVDGHLTLFVDLPASSVVLIIITGDNELPLPAMVENLRIKKFHGLNKETLCFLEWEYPVQDNIKTYEVYFSEEGKEYSKISDLIMEKGFLDSESRSPGRYKVRAVDYLGQSGEFSKEVSN